MTSLFVGLYGLYLIIVGGRGNAGYLVEYLRDDARGYVPWLMSIIVISILTEYNTTRDLVKPIIGLLMLNFALRNFDTIEAEFKKIYSMGAK